MPLSSGMDGASPKSQLDWLSVVALWVGAVVMAIKAGDLPLMASAPSWFGSHVWSYVPVVLVSFYLVVSLHRLLRPTKQVLSQHPPARYSAMAKPPVPEPQKNPDEAPYLPATVRQDERGRTFLSSNVSPFALMEMCDDKTDIHADKAMEPYVGKWYRYSGSVKNVSIVGKNVYIRFETGSALGIRAMVSNNLELADVIHRGDQLTVEGKIKRIDSVAFELADAEVVER